jgi:endo-1,4-beta-xylanase
MLARRIVPALLALALPSIAAAALAPLARCEALKLSTAAKSASLLLKCQARAITLGVPVDPTCVAKATAKLTSGFARAELAGGCPFIGEATTVDGVLQAAATALAAQQTPIVGGSDCGFRKVAAVGKRIGKRLKSEGSHTKRPERGRLVFAVDAITERYALDVAKAVSEGDCVTSGDGGDLATAADTVVADVLDLVRGNLGALATAHGKRIGAAVRATVLDAMEPEYRDLLARQFNQVTPEYELMWGNIEPVQGTLQLAPVETILEFAETHGFPVVGSPLLWHLILPPWVNGGMTPAHLQAAVDARIDTLLGMYAGRIGTWVVVNEAINDFGGGLRPSIFLNELGPGYIADAFRRARLADPNALLFYNDYLAEGSNGKADAIYAMVVDLLAQGVPIDGVGFQAHLGGLYAFFGATVPGGIQPNLQRFVDLGLRVALTEMDVQANALGETPSERRAAQRDVYQSVLGACVAVAGCDSMTFWGFTDRHTWIRDFLGIPDDPLPWDERYLPKAAFFGVRDALIPD